MLTVDRFALNQYRTEQNTNCFGMRQAPLVVRRGPKLLEECIETKSLDDMVDQRQRPKPLGMQGERGVPIACRLTCHDLATI